jgi:AcrR family transcriptional regulator
MTSGDDDQRLGLRERKKRETRAMLSWAAIQLTVERGLDNVRVEDIAEAAGVSTRTFNNYFSSKGEAIVSRHLDRYLRLAEKMRRRPASEPLWESVKRVALTELDPGPEVIAHPVPDRQQWVAGIRLMIAEPAIQGEFLRAGATAEAEIAAAIAERSGTDVKHDLYPWLVAATIIAAINAATQHWLRAGPPAEMKRLLIEAIDRLAAGLPTP